MKFENERSIHLDFETLWYNGVVWAGRVALNQYVLLGAASEIAVLKEDN